MTQPPPPTNPGSPPDAPGTRRVGHLYQQVALHLTEHPDTILKVGEITKAIGARSAGAVFEALKRMAAAGHATHHTDPHRFQVTKAGIDAAGSANDATFTFDAEQTKNN